MYMDDKFLVSFFFFRALVLAVFLSSLIYKVLFILLDVFYWFIGFIAAFSCSVHICYLLPFVIFTKAFQWLFHPMASPFSCTFCYDSIEKLFLVFAIWKPFYSLQFLVILCLRLGITDIINVERARGGWVWFPPEDYVFI